MRSDTNRNAQTADCIAEPATAYVKGMARRRSNPKRVSVSVRLTVESAAKLRDFVKWHSGGPLFLELGPFVEQAVLAEIQRTELKLSGALPMEGRTRPRHASNSINNSKA